MRDDTELGGIFHLLECFFRGFKALEYGIY